MYQISILRFQVLFNNKVEVSRFFISIRSMQYISCFSLSSSAILKEMGVKKVMIKENKSN